MSSALNSDEIADELRELEEAYAAEQAAARRTARATLAVAISLVVVTSAFAIANIANFRKEWTPEKFSASLNRELRELQPRASEELRLLGKELLPVYAEEGRRQVRRMSPEMAGHFERELGVLSREIAARAHVRLEAAHEALLGAVEEAVKTSFPALREEAMERILADRLRTTATGALLGAITEFERRFGREVDTFRETLLTFELGETGQDAATLQKKFLRLWLQLLDQEIMEL